jgi:hypothetical protein
MEGTKVLYAYFTACEMYPACSRNIGSIGPTRKGNAQFSSSEQRLNVSITKTTEENTRRGVCHRCNQRPVSKYQGSIIIAEKATQYACWQAGNKWRGCKLGRKSRARGQVVKSRTVENRAV